MLFLNLFLTYQDSIFGNGNKFYREGFFEEALKEYQKILYLRNPYLYYNIGNAYYRLNEKGLALLYYKRAFYYIPRDNDIRHNIEIIEGKKNIENPILRFLFFYLNILSLRESFTIFIILYGIGMLLLTLFFINRTKVILVFSIISLLFSIFPFTISLNWIYKMNSPEAVVIKNTIGRSGPGNNFQEIVEFSEGTSGKVLKTDNDWKLFSNGREIGWVKEGIEMVLKK